MYSDSVDSANARDTGISDAGDSKLITNTRAASRQYVTNFDDFIEFLSSY